MNLSHNIVLITGGTSGIGKSLVEKLSSMDNELIVVAKDKQKLESLEKEISHVKTICCDLSQQYEVDNLIQYCIDNHPDINVIINNAGVECNYLLLDEESFISKANQEIQINLLAPMQITHGLIPLLVGKPQAAVVNITSGLVYAPKYNAAVYNASKSGLRAFTQTLRMQLKQTRIQVFEVIPPLVDTPLSKVNQNRKMSVEECVTQILDGLRKNKLIMNIGVVKWVSIISRISPKLLSTFMTRRYKKSL